MRSGSSPQFPNLQVRCGIAKVLSDIFRCGAIEAGVGPSVLETINALLIHLRLNGNFFGLEEFQYKDIENQSRLKRIMNGHVDFGDFEMFILQYIRTSCETMNRCKDGRAFNEAVLAALGEYSSSLPNFQIIEIIIFILGKVSIPSPLPQSAFPTIK